MKQFFTLRNIVAVLSVVVAVLESISQAKSAQRGNLSETPNP